MFGTNDIAKPRAEADGFLVHSIFYTIQGEGPFAGEPAIFLRLAGCNLRCYWCDTEFEEGQSWSLGDLAERLFEMSCEHKCELIIITGGEPMLQAIGTLMGAASLSNCRFQIETAGGGWSWSMARMNTMSRKTPTIVCSPKTPIVAEQLRQKHPVFDIYWKYIVRADEPVDEQDGLPIYSTQQRGSLTPGKPIYKPGAWVPRSRIFVQACDVQDEQANKANLRHAAAIAMKHGYRLSVQLHKIVDVP